MSNIAQNEEEDEAFQKIKKGFRVNHMLMKKRKWRGNVGSKLMGFKQRIPHRKYHKRIIKV